MTLPLRLRLTLFYTIALLVALCAFAADVWWVEGQIGLRRVDHDLDGLSSTVARLMREESAESSPLDAAAGEISDALSVPDRAIAFFDASGRIVSTNGEDSWLSGALTPGSDTVRSLDTSHGTWRVQSEHRTYGETPTSIVLAASLRDVARGQHEVVETMWFALPLALLLAGGGGWWVASVALRPITGMARQATRITATGVDTLEAAGRSDEVGAFATAFNGLLARLRDALRAQRQFMADASHELRTPVSIVRTAADVALDRAGRDESEYREALSTIGAQAQRLTRLVDSMLVLARADAGGYPVGRADLYLDEVIDECCRAVAMTCRQRGVALRVGPFDETPFRGDEDLLRQLVLNVLQNAVEHTPAGATVGVTLTTTADRVTLTISDSGSGIAESDRERIFERFVRLDASRTRRGAGLGLPIARWIAEAHGGSLILAHSSPEGSTFRILLPRSVPPAAASI